MMNKLRILLSVLVALVTITPLSAQQNLWQAKGVTSPEVLDDIVKFVKQVLLRKKFLMRSGMKKKR